jgi:hypothetical protein
MSVAMSGRGLILQVRPPRFRRHPKDALGSVLVARLEQFVKLFALDAIFRQLGPQIIAAALEAVGDVLEKQQPENDVLVLGGIDLSAQGVGGFPKVRGEIEIGVWLRHAVRCLGLNRK